MFVSRSCIILLIFGLFQNVAILTSAQEVSEQDGPIAETKLGKFEGTYNISRNGKYYSSFIGIPFARVERRFEPPQPILEPWNGIKNATQYGPVCSQFNLALRMFEGEEDCLFLNVFTPDIKPERKRSVLLYIHGGAWFTGNGKLYGEKYFIDEDIVYVTINYRLAALGFLSTADGKVAGNMGQKDQVMALRWIQENIEAFGGDKDRVTIAGTSAGATSVALLIVSPMAAGLFHGASIQSGSAISSWTVTEPKQAEDNAFEFGSKIGCVTKSTEELVDCLRKQPVENLLKAHLAVSKWYIDPIPYFTPTIEIPKSVSGQETFLEELPRTLLEEGRFNHVPVIMTVCKDEGLALHSAALWKNKALRDDLNQNWTRIAPITLRYDLDPELDIQNEAESNELSQKVRNFYFGDSEITENSLENLTTMYSDRGFFQGAHTTVQLLAKNNISTYSGIFTYIGGEQSAISLFGVNEILGMSHGDDALYFFSGTHLKPLNEKSVMYSKYIVNLWANFVKTGVPTSDLKDVTWPKTSLKDVETNSLTWFDLNNNNGTHLFVNPYKKQNEFWDQVYSQYGVRRMINSEGSDTTKTEAGSPKPECTNHKVVCTIKKFFKSKFQRL